MKLTVSKNKRFFCCDDRPFFWLGDTAWLLFEKLTEEEAALYLTNRAAKGFTVIQSTLVHTKDFRNRKGYPALLEDDFSRPDPDNGHDAYWPTVRRIVDTAAKMGLVMALLPSWGCFVSDGSLCLDDVEAYTDRLAGVFGDCTNVIWLLGGDVRGSDGPEVFNALGSALKKKCPSHLVGFHPFGRCCSSQWFQDAPWLDFHLFQSGHRRYDQVRLNQWDDKVDAETFLGEDTYLYVRRDYHREPIRPILDGEPSYEFILQGLHDPSQPYWQTRDVRRYAYWSLLAGAAGFTYGSNSIMQFFLGNEKGSFGVFETWQEALHDPGSMQMAHLRRFMEDTAWHTGRPAQERLIGNCGKKYDYDLALETERGLCVYTFSGHPFHVRTSGIGPASGWWADPVSGVKSYFGRVPAADSVLFTPPDRHSDQNDWLLLLEK